MLATVAMLFLLGPVKPTPAPVVSYRPDEYSAVDYASISGGSWSTQCFSRMELVINAALGKKDPTFREYSLLIKIEGGRYPLEITRINLKGGDVLPPQSAPVSGPPSCTALRYSSRCYGDGAQFFTLSPAMLAALRAGESQDLRIRTTNGEQCDWTATLSPQLLAPLDVWVGEMDRKRQAAAASGAPERRADNGVNGGNIP
jgi:hypothetical protein